MRATCLCLIVLGVLGCGRIDTGNKPVATPAPPTVTVPDNTARTSTTAADTASPRDESRRDVARDRAKPPEANAEPDNTAVNARDTNRETREPKRRFRGRAPLLRTFRPLLIRSCAMRAVLNTIILRLSWPGAASRGP